MITPLLAPPIVLSSKADIAAMAGVQRSVVTKWVARGLGFPEPVEDGLYDPCEVVDWLIRTGHGKRGQQELEEEVSLYTLAGLTGHYEGDFIGAVTGLICLRYLNDEATRLDEDTHDAVAAARTLASDLDPEDGLLLREIRAIPHHAGWLVSAVDDIVEAAYNCADALERVITARTRFGPAIAARAGATTAMSAPLTRLITELSGARELAQRKASIVVADPAASVGDLLIAIADILSEDTEPRFTGAEADPGLARLALRRLAVRGVQPEDRDLRVSAELRDDTGNPDVIVTQLSYQPGEDRDAYAIIDALGDIGVRLTRGRFAIVVGPADVLADDLPAGPAEERAKLLQSDMVEAIIRLPIGLVPYLPRYRTALWVLTQARASHWKGHVLTIDVSDRDLTHDLVDAIADEVITWRRDGYQPFAHGRSLAVDKLVRNLVDPPRSLMGGDARSGERERKKAASARLTGITQHGVDLDYLADTATAVRRHVPAEFLIAADRHPPTESLGRLITGGRLVLRSGTRINARHLTTTGTHPVLGPAEIHAPQQNGPIRRFDRATFASRHPRARLTEPGDVVVTLTPTPAAIVDHAGYSIAEFPLRILRIPDSEQPHFTPRVLAALLFGEGKFRAGQALEDYRIPLLAADEVARLDELLAELEARRELAQRETQALDDLRRVALRGLIDGTLSLNIADTASDNK